MHLVTAVHALDRNQRLPLQAEEAAALAAGLAVAEQRVQAAVGAREAEMQAQAEAALRASVLAQAQQRVQDQVGPPQDSHWHWLGSLLLVQYAQLAMLTVNRGRCPVLPQRTTWSLLVTGLQACTCKAGRVGVLCD